MKRIPASLTLVVACVAAGTCSSEPPPATETVTRTASALSAWAPGWYDLAGHAYGQAVAKRGTNPVVLDVWSTGINSGALWRDTYTPPLWTGWVSKNGGPPGGILGPPAVAATSTGAVIVVKDISSKVWWTQWTSSSDTFACPPPGTGCVNSVWAQVGSATGIANGTPAVLLNGADVFVYVRGTNNVMWLARFTAGTHTWSAWDNAGGAPPGGVLGSPAAFVYINPGFTQHLVFVRGTNGHIWQNGRFVNGGMWGTWFDIGGGSVINSPAVTPHADGSFGMEVYAQATDGSVSNYTWSPGVAGTWHFDFQPPVPGAAAGGVVQSDYATLSAIYRGTSYSNGFDLMATGAAGNTYYTSWYSTGPAMTTTGAQVAATQRQLTGMLNWENSALVIPPNAAGCGPNGWAAIEPGGNQPVITAWPKGGTRLWRTDLTCVNGTSGSTCPGPGVVLSYADPQWPAHADPSFWDDAGLAPDEQLARLPNGTILLMKQGARHDARDANGNPITGVCPGRPGPQASGCRGVEFLFKSTDCGTTFQFVSVLDSKSDGPTGDRARYFNPNTLSGHDRDELYVDPFAPAPSTRVYVTVQGKGTNSDARLLYRSDDGGVTWINPADPKTDPIEIPGVYAPGYMTSLPSGKLYMVNSSSTSLKLMLTVYDPTTRTISAPLDTGLSFDVFPTGCSPGVDCVRISVEHYGISRVGTLGDGDYVRVHGVVRRPSGDYALAVRILKIKNNAVTAVGASCTSDSGCAAGNACISGTCTTLETASAPGRSILGAMSMETDRLELSNSLLNPAVIVWYDVRTTAVNGDYGPASARFRFFWDFNSSASGPLSVDSAGAPRTWPTYTTFTPVQGVGTIGTYGDYTKGAFWYEAGATPKLHFLAQWGEQPAFDAQSVGTNVVTFTP
jgi:hypothetical protein